MESYLYKTGKEYEERGEVEKAYFYYLESAMTEGDAESFLALGIMYSDGIYVHQDSAKACHYMELALEKGMTLRVGDYLMLGSYRHLDVPEGRYYGLYKDMDLAIKYYKTDIDMGFDCVYKNLGQAYMEPECCDYKKAYQCFRKYENCEMSKYYLGLMYEKGMYVKQNTSKAVSYYKQAIKIDEADDNEMPDDLYYEESVERLIELGIGNYFAKQANNTK